MAASKSHHTDETKANEPLTFTLDNNISKDMNKKLDEMRLIELGNQYKLKSYLKQKGYYQFKELECKLDLQARPFERKGHSQVQNDPSGSTKT